MQTDSNEIASETAPVVTEPTKVCIARYDFREELATTKANGSAAPFGFQRHDFVVVTDEQPNSSRPSGDAEYPENWCRVQVCNTAQIGVAPRIPTPGEPGQGKTGGFEPWSWILAPADVDVYTKKVLGSGNFGVVTAGSFRPGYSNTDHINEDGSCKCGGACEYQSYIDVAIKTCKPTIRDSAKEEFETDLRNEATLMMNLFNPHILRIWGVANIDTRTHVVMERLQTSLKDHLKKSGRAIVKLGQLEMVCHQVANALTYLESINCCHRDLAARNVLIPDTSLKGVKLADFGRARMLRGSGPFKANADEAEPVKWMPPEGLKKGATAFTTRSDIWSFGVLIVEMLKYGEMPFPGISNEHFRAAVLSKTKPMNPMDKKRLPGVPDRLRSVIDRCWEFEGNDRPSAQQLYAEFSKYRSVINAEKRVPTKSTALQSVATAVGGGPGSTATMEFRAHKSKPGLTTLAQDMPVPVKSEPLPTSSAAAAGMIVRDRIKTMKGVMSTISRGEYKGFTVLVVDVVPVDRRPAKLLRDPRLMNIESMFSATVRASNLLGMIAHREVATGTSRSAANIIFEAASGGSLRRYLFQKKQSGDPVGKSIQREFAAEIATGMAYLESQSWMHRDLGTRNVLLAVNPHGAKPIAKIMDSGFSMRVPGKFVASTTSTICKSCRQDPSGKACTGCFFETVQPLEGSGMSLPPMALKWAAPEAIMAPFSFSSKNDVFAFGVMLQELATDGKAPYPGAPAFDHDWWVEKLTAARSDEAGRTKYARGGHSSMQIIPDNAHPFAALIRECCWELRPCKRPSFIEIQFQLEQMAVYEDVDANEDTGPDPLSLMSMSTRCLIQTGEENARLDAEQEKEERDLIAGQVALENAERNEITTWLSTGQGASSNKLKFLDTLRAECVLFQQVAFYHFLQKTKPFKIHEILKELFERATQATASLKKMFEITTANYQRELESGGNGMLWAALTALDLAEPGCSNAHHLCNSKESNWQELLPDDQVTMLNTEASWLRPVFELNLNEICDMLNDTTLEDTQDLAIATGLWQCLKSVLIQTDIEESSNGKRTDESRQKLEAKKSHTTKLPDGTRVNYCTSERCKHTDGGWTDSSNARQLDSIFKNDKGEWHSLPNPYKVAYIATDISGKEPMVKIPGADTSYPVKKSDVPNMAVATLFLQNCMKCKTFKIDWDDELKGRGPPDQQFTLVGDIPKGWSIDSGGGISGLFYAPGVYKCIVKAGGVPVREIEFNVSIIPRVKFTAGPPKDTTRALQKAKKRYGGKLDKCRDLLRGTIECESVLMMAIAHTLFDQCKAFTKNTKYPQMQPQHSALFESLQMVRSKNMFKKKAHIRQINAAQLALDCYEDAYAQFNLLNQEAVTDDYSSLYSEGIGRPPPASGVYSSPYEQRVYDGNDDYAMSLYSMSVQGQPRQQTSASAASSPDSKDVTEFQPPRLHTNINFKGHVAEIQMLLQRHAQIKDMLHPYYQILRGFKVYKDDYDKGKFGIPQNMVQSVFVLSEIDMESENYLYNGPASFDFLKENLKGKWDALIQMKKETKLHQTTRDVFPDDLKEVVDIVEDMKTEYFVSGCNDKESPFNGKYIKTGRRRYQQLVQTKAQLKPKVRVRTMEYSTTQRCWRLVVDGCGSFQSPSEGLQPPKAGWENEESKSNVPSIIALPRSFQVEPTGDVWKEAVEWLASAGLLERSVVATPHQKWTTSDFYRHLQDGVTLCLLANSILPGAVRGGVITLKPKNESEKAGNIDAFLAFAPMAFDSDFDLFCREDLSKPVGSKVTVEGYACGGTVRYIGPHLLDPAKGNRVLVELDEPVGNNDGTVMGASYCATLPRKTGVLVAPDKVVAVATKVVRCLLMLKRTFPTLNQSEGDIASMTPDEKLLSEERTHVHELTLLVDTFMKPKAKVLSKSDHSVLFSNAAALLNLHDGFLSKLNPAASDSTIGTVFLEYIPKMCIYLRYWCNLPKALNVLKALASSKPEAYAGLKELLLAPVDRLHAYGSYLGTVAKGKGRPNHKKLAKALVEYRSLMKRLKHNKLYQLLGELEGHKDIPLKSFAPLIFDSEVVCRNVKAKKKLFSKSLVSGHMFMLQKGKVLVVEAKKSKFKFKFVCTIEKDMKVVGYDGWASLADEFGVDEDENDGMDHVFSLSSGTARYIFAVAEAGIKEKWMKCFTRRSRAQSKFAYTARNLDELTFERGVELTILSTDDPTLDPGWWRGTLPNGQTGIFPANYVQRPG